MKRSISVYCLACDHEHECPIIYGEFEGDDDFDVPEDCEACGESLDAGESDYREDFHSDI